MESIINHCRDAYSWMDDDTKTYHPGWVLASEDEQKELEKLETPWVYQSSVKMKNAPYVGTLTTYKGGGYAMLSRRDLCRTKQVCIVGLCKCTHCAHEGGSLTNKELKSCLRIKYLNVQMYLT